MAAGTTPKRSRVLLATAMVRYPGPGSEEVASEEDLIAAVSEEEVVAAATADVVAEVVATEAPGEASVTNLTASPPTALLVAQAEAVTEVEAEEVGTMIVGLATPTTSLYRREAVVTATVIAMAEVGVAGMEDRRGRMRVGMTTRGHGEGTDQQERDKCGRGKITPANQPTRGKYTNRAGLNRRKPRTDTKDLRCTLR